MSRFLQFLSILIFPCLVSGDPKILYLNVLNSWVTSVITGVEVGASLYVASSDDTRALAEIYVTTGNFSTSLDQINVPNGHVTIIDGLRINTRNNDSVVQNLTGFLYVTTKKQSDDSHFSVFVVKESQVISIANLNSIAVILNTRPLKTSYVSEIEQDLNTDMSFHWSIPSDQEEKNTFFENPVYTPYYAYNGVIYNNTRRFFSNIEPLQITLDYWYLTSSGAVTLKIENKYSPDYNYTTTAISTTGLIMNYNENFTNQVVNFQLDLTRERVVGTLISTMLKSDSEVDFTYVDANGGPDYKQQFTNTTPTTQYLWYDSIQASKLLISSNTLQPGTFYCQYFGISGDLLLTTTTVGSSTSEASSSSSLGSTSTTVPSTVTSTMVTFETTTKSRGGRFHILCTISLTFLWLLEL